MRIFLMRQKPIDWKFVIRSYTLWVFLPLAVLFTFGPLLIGDDLETKEKREWCKEYHPEKSGAECARIAGW